MWDFVEFDFVGQIDVVKMIDSELDTSLVYPDVEVVVIPSFVVSKDVLEGFSVTVTVYQSITVVVCRCPTGGVL